LDSGADLELRCENKNCNTPLHAAVAGGQVESGKFLVNQGANLNARYAGGTRVLHEAAFTGRGEVVRVLMELGADKSITNEDGKTPAEVAELRGHETIAALLRD